MFLYLQRCLEKWGDAEMGQLIAIWGSEISRKMLPVLSATELFLHSICWTWLWAQNTNQTPWHLPKLELKHRWLTLVFNHSLPQCLAPGSFSCHQKWVDSGVAAPVLGLILKLILHVLTSVDTKRRVWKIRLVKTGSESNWVWTQALEDLAELGLHYALCLNILFSEQRFTKTLLFIHGNTINNDQLCQFTTCNTSVPSYTWSKLQPQNCFH